MINLYDIVQGCKKHRGHLVHMASTIAPEIAEDIVQEYFLILLKKDLIFFKDEKEFFQYSMTAVKNMALNVVKNKRQIRTVDMAYFSPDWFPDPVNDVMKREMTQEERQLHNALMLAVEALPGKRKQVMKLRFSGQMPADIAAKLHISLRTVKNNTYIAIDEIRSYLKLTQYDAKFADMEKNRRQFFKRLSKQIIANTVPDNIDLLSHV